MSPEERLDAVEANLATLEQAHAVVLQAIEKLTSYLKGLPATGHHPEDL
jgi:hypothetical protein